MANAKDGRCNVNCSKNTLTSTDINAKVLNPPKNPTNTDTRSMNPERIKILPKRSISFT